jgi:phage tail-like protein
MATGDRVSPFRGYNFRVEIAGTTDDAARFREATVPACNTDVIEYRVGSSRDLHPMKLPGLRKSANLVFRWGITLNNELALWYRQIVNGVDDRRNGSVVLLDEQFGDVVRWNFYEAWPCKLEGPTLNAGTSEAAIVALELCVEKTEQQIG